jgi:hypothetical protein
MRLLVSLAIWLLKHNKITGVQKSRLTSHLLENIHAYPIKDTIQLQFNKNVMINGRELAVEQTIALRESCKALNDNWSRKIIHEQLQFEAVKMGIHNGLNPDTLMFAKAILWTIQEEQKLIEKLAE